MKSISLVGFMGCGKTTVGKVLAGKLNIQFFDLDEQIEAREGISIGKIFAQKGEAYFRVLEWQALKSLGEGDKILSVGGGAYTIDDNIELINANSTSFWLDCPIEVCLERCVRATNERPLFNDPEQFANLFKHRKRFYSRAHHTLGCCDDTPDEIAGQIIQLLEN